MKGYCRSENQEPMVKPNFVLLSREEKKKNIGKKGKAANKRGLAVNKRQLAAGGGDSFNGVSPQRSFTEGETRNRCETKRGAGTSGRVSADINQDSEEWIRVEGALKKRIKRGDRRRVQRVYAMTEKKRSRGKERRTKKRSLR